MFPIRRTHQHPCPLAERVHRVARDSVSQFCRSRSAFLLCVTDIACKMLLLCLGIQIGRELRLNAYHDESSQNWAELLNSWECPWHGERLDASPQGRTNVIKT